ncbi:MAG TPA: hypothetical protein VMW18_18165 [Candidatus Binatia bacterium]|nr:hypothetical protein [Candidatus Binatia bacterium]
MSFRKIAALALLLAACETAAPPPAQVSPADIARQAAAPIPVSPRVAKIYREDYLAQVGKDSSGVFAISPNGNRFYFRTCHHPDCGLSEDELAARAIDRCNIGIPSGDAKQKCLVFDRSGTVVQPYRFWTEVDFDAPISPPPALVVTDAQTLAPGRFTAMTPEGQLAISLRADGRAYFWDTGDTFHQGTWSVKDSGLCVTSVDQRATVTCGTLYGTDPAHIVGVRLDLFPGRFLPVTRLSSPSE